MHRTPFILALAALSVTLASCYGPQEEPRPFAGRGARSLDNPPRFGENRYMDNVAPEGPRSDPALPPGVAVNGAPTTPGVNGPIDPGLKAAPGTTITTTTTVTPPADPAAVSTPVKPAATDVPYARAVPGKPGFVYSPHEQGKILDVTGLRPGTKVKDPQTGAMFRVP